MPQDGSSSVFPEIIGAPPTAKAPQMCIDCGELISVLYGLCHKCLKKSHEASRVAEMSLPGGLRDQFAMAAMVGLIFPNGHGQADLYANDAYKIADAMLEARKPK